MLSHGRFARTRMLGTACSRVLAPEISFHSSFPRASSSEAVGIGSSTPPSSDRSVSRRQPMENLTQEVIVADSGASAVESGAQLPKDSSGR